MTLQEAINMTLAIGVVIGVLEAVLVIMLVQHFAYRARLKEK